MFSKAKDLFHIQFRSVNIQKAGAVVEPDIVDVNSR